MVSAVTVKSNTGSTIAIIVTLLGLGIAGYFIATRALKDFKFPDFKFPEFKFPEFNFQDLFGPNIEDVSNLRLTPQGSGIGIEQLKEAFRVSFPSGSSISRSVGPRPILSPGQFGVTGRRLPPRAVAFRIPTFVGTVTTPLRGTRLIAGSEALFARIMDNLRRASNRQFSKPTAPLGNRPGERTVDTRYQIPNRFVVSRTGFFKGVKVAESTVEARRRLFSEQDRRRRRGR